MSLSFEPPSHVLSKDRAFEILSPHFENLKESLFLAWEEWLELGRLKPEWHVNVTLSGRARLVHDWAVDFAKPRFEGRDGIRTKTAHDTLMLIFGEDIVLRMKYFDQGLRPKNSRTKVQDDINQLSLNLPGLPSEATPLTLGYTVDEATKEIAKIAITCQWLHSHLYVIGLYDSNEGDLFQGISPIPAPGDDDSEPKTTILPLLPKPPKKKKNQDDE